MLLQPLGHLSGLKPEAEASQEWRRKIVRRLLRNRKSANRRCIIRRVCGAAVALTHCLDGCLRAATGSALLKSLVFGLKRLSNGCFLGKTAIEGSDPKGRSPRSEDEPITLQSCGSGLQPRHVRTSAQPAIGNPGHSSEMWNKCSVVGISHVSGLRRLSNGHQSWRKCVSQFSVFNRRLCQKSVVGQPLKPGPT